MWRRVLCVLAASITLPATRGADLLLPPAIQSGFRIGGAPHSLSSIGTDAGGNIYLAGSFIGAIALGTGFPVASKTTLGPKDSPPRLFVAKVSPSGRQLLYVTEINHSYPAHSYLGGMAVTPDGSVILAGYTQATDYPTTEGSLQPRSVNGGAFLLRLDRSGQRLVFSTFLDDSAQTRASSLFVDADGNCYLGGYTDGRTFPTTPGAYQRTVLPRPSGTGPLGFVAKVSADGRGLLFSTLFNESAVTGIAVDAAGAIHITGMTLLAVMDPAASRVLYSRELPDINRVPLLAVDRSGSSYVALSTYYGSSVRKYRSTGALLYEKQLPGANLWALLASDDGTVFAAGSATMVGFPTRDSLQPCNMNLHHDYVPVQWWLQSAAFSVLDPEGKMVHSSFLGGSAPSGHGNDSNSIVALARGQDGLLYLAGFSSSPDFPGGPTLISGPGFAFGMKLDLGAVARGRTSAACLALATVVEAPLMPSALMTVLGSNLGPVTGASFRLDANNRVPSELAGVRVTAGGVEAPLLYVQEQQINFIVPQEVAGATTNVCVINQEGQSCLLAYVGDVSPGIFRVGDGYAVLNEDGSLNTPANPAVLGSVISLFGTGFGPFDRSMPDGSVSVPPLPRLVKTVRATFLSVPLAPGRWVPPRIAGNVLYAGAAPGLVHGVAQLNIRVPTGLWAGRTAVYLEVDGGTVPKYRQPLGVHYITVKGP